MNISEKDLKRFWSKVDKNGEHWLWTAAKNQNGYGIFRYKHKNWLAHRFSYLLSHEKDMDYIPEGLEICHTCDITSCVNPYCLWAGTHQDNMLDNANKGRHLTGDMCPWSKLTEDDVVLIRYRYSCGDINQYELAKEFDVSQVEINHIVNNKRWKHLE